MTTDLSIQKKAKKALNEFLNRIDDEVKIQIYKLIVFGSYVTSEMGDHSDIDVLIITSDDWYQLRKQLSDLIMDIELQYDIVLSVKTVAKKEYLRRKEEESGFFSKLHNEGVEIELQ